MTKQHKNKRPRPAPENDSQQPSTRRLLHLRRGPPAAADQPGRLGLLRLPAELMLMVAEGLKSRKDLDALSRSCIKIGTVAADSLYTRDGPDALFWGVRHNKIEVVAKALQYIHPNVYDPR